jgi:hypothetical protein
LKKRTIKLFIFWAYAAGKNRDCDMNAIVPVSNHLAFFSIVAIVGSKNIFGSGPLFVANCLPQCYAVAFWG